MVEKRFVDGFEFAISQFGEIHAGYLGQYVGLSVIPVRPHCTPVQERTERRSYQVACMLYSSELGKYLF